MCFVNVIVQLTISDDSTDIEVVIRYKYRPGVCGIVIIRSTVLRSNECVNNELGNVNNIKT